MKNKRRFFLGLLVVTVIGATAVGCAAYPYLVAAYRSTDQFAPHPQDVRVRFESGAEPVAARVAGFLGEAVREVERAHGRTFKEPVCVHVCATERTMMSYLPSHDWGAAAGWVYARRLFLAPRLAETPQRIRTVTTHELSHLHLEQYLGTRRHRLGIPRWFREGLAVVASKGGGAENASEAESRALIARGTQLAPDDSGTLFEVPSSRYGLSQHQYYRQSAMFVAFLKSRGEDRFNRMMSSLIEGACFAEAFRAGYEMTVAQAWAEFAQGLGKG